MKKIDPENYDPSIEPVIDKVYSLANAVVATVPVVGGPLTEVIASIVSPPHKKRMENWLHALTTAVNKLIESDKKLQEQLSDDPLFLTSVVRCSDAAIRTSNEEVIDGLVNTVVAVARSQTIDEVKLQMCLRSISGMTSLHMKLLQYINSLQNTFLSDVLSDDDQQVFFLEAAAYDQELVDKTLVSRAMQDMYNDKLVDLPHNAARSLGGPNYINMRFTDLGFDVLKLIKGRGLKNAI